ncbi:MAG: glucoamylase family protein [Haloarculaceae archaeon]
MRDGDSRGSAAWSRRRLLATGAASVATALGSGLAGATSTGQGTSDPPGAIPAGRSAHSLDSFLHGVAAGSYDLVRTFADGETGLVPDRIDVADGEAQPGDRTSPANVGVQLLSTVAAHDLGIVPERDARSRVARVLDTLESADTWNGLFRRWYAVDDGSVHDSASAANVSTIDNGWLSAGLLVAGRAFDSLGDRARSLVAAQDYSALYEPEIYDLFESGFASPGLLHAKYDPDGGGLVGTFGALNAETRIAYYVAIGKGDIPAGSWWQMYRTFPPGDAYSWTNQDPDGETRTYRTDGDSIDVFEGHYEYFDRAYVPSWGGSMFEALMPSLVVNERALGEANFAANNRRHAQVQVAYADESDYDAWGFSPAATPNGGYGVFAVDQLGMSGYERDDFVTPHATFLALEYLDEGTIRENLRQFQRWGARGDYGFYDSVERATGRVTRSYLILDQAMSIAAIANYLTDGTLRDRFHADPVAGAAEDLLTTETFSI